MRPAPGARTAAGTMARQLDVALPYEPGPAMATLAAHAVPGAEIAVPADAVPADAEPAGPGMAGAGTGSHTRLIATAEGPVAVTIRFAADHVLLETSASGAGPGEGPGNDRSPATAASMDAVTRMVRWWLDLDADLPRIHQALGSDPVLGPLLAARPGLRVIGNPDGFAAAVGTVLGQQVSLAAGRTFTGRLVAAYGRPGPAGLTVFPTPESLASVSPDELQQAVRVTGARARTVHALAEACADGLRIDRHGDHAHIRRSLLAVPGIGPWTVDYLAVRALGDRDAYPAGDLVLRRALGGVSAKTASLAAAGWSPYRAYALFQLWTQATYASTAPALHGSTVRRA